MFFILIFPKFSYKEILQKCPSSNFFDVLDYCFRNKILYVFRCYPDDMFSDDCFQFYMESDNSMIFHATFKKEWSFD